MTRNGRLPLLLALASSLSLAACDGSQGEAPARLSKTHQAIVGGAQSTAADDAVVLLNLGQGLCTGTLVAPNLVITARHCLASLDETQECGAFGAANQPSTISVSLGVTAGQSSPVAAKGKQIIVETQTSSCGFDIGFVVLDRDIPNAKVAALRTSALKQGEPARTVGYGDNGNGQLTNGRFARTNLAVDGVGPNTFTWQTDQGQNMQVPVAAGELVTGESTCFGDSGGPLFDAQGAIIGVTSRGIDGSCLDRPSIFSGIFTHTALVTAAEKASGHTLGQGGTTPSTTNPGTGTGTGKGTGTGTTNGDTGDDAANEDDPSKSSSGRANLDNGNVASSGCSASASRHSTDPILVGFVLGAALAMLGRRRVRSTDRAARTPG